MGAGRHTRRPPSTFRVLRRRSAPCADLPERRASSPSRARPGRIILPPMPHAAHDRRARPALALVVALALAIALAAPAAPPPPPNDAPAATQAAPAPARGDRCGAGHPRGAGEGAEAAIPGGEPLDAGLYDRTVWFA